MEKTPSELNNFCENVVSVEVSIPVTSDCFMATKILRAEIQSFQIAGFYAQDLLQKVA